jgi:hypothetical protein
MNIDNESLFFYSRDLFDLQDSNSEGTKENAGSQNNAHSNRTKFSCAPNSIIGKQKILTKTYELSVKFPINLV